MSTVGYGNYYFNLLESYKIYRILKIINLWTIKS